MSDLDSLKYTEQCSEMRRYRDYQLSITTWYTSILIAIIGGVLSFRFSDKKDEFIKFIEIWYIKDLLLFLIFAITFTGLYNVFYTHNKYKNIKSIVIDRENDDWREKASYWKVKDIKIQLIQPHYFIYLTFIILCIIGTVVIQ